MDSKAEASARDGTQRYDIRMADASALRVSADNAYEICNGGCLGPTRPTDNAYETVNTHN
jgi:hypothetical protein